MLLQDASSSSIEGLGGCTDCGVLHASLGPTLPDITHSVGRVANKTSFQVQRAGCIFSVNHLCIWDAAWLAAMRLALIREPGSGPPRAPRMSVSIWTYLGIEHHKRHTGRRADISISHSLLPASQPSFVVRRGSRWAARASWLSIHIPQRSCQKESHSTSGGSDWLRTSAICSHENGQCSCPHRPCETCVRCISMH